MGFVGTLFGLLTGGGGRVYRQSVANLTSFVAKVSINEGYDIGLVRRSVRHLHRTTSK